MSIGFIGMGNMGYAMLRGALDSLKDESIIYTDANFERMEYVKKETGIDYVVDNVECVKNSKYIVLSIKPQYYSLVIKEIRKYVNKNQVLISIAPGISIEDLRKEFDEGVRIVRAMPNTPALVGEGMSGISFCKGDYTKEEHQFIVNFFKSFGMVEIMEEQLMDVVVCASGSSPAYVFMFIEALADSVVKYGMPRDKAYKFVAQTILGSAKMVLDTNEHPAKLKDQVCSPLGTTIQGVSALEEYGFRNAVMKATDKCFERASGIKK